MSAPKPRLRVLSARVWDADREVDAKEHAAFLRSYGYIARTYRRTVRAGRASVPAIVVVAYEKPQEVTE